MPRKYKHLKISAYPGVRFYKTENEKRRTKKIIVSETWCFLHGDLVHATLAQV